MSGWSLVFQAVVITRAFDRDFLRRFLSTFLTRLPKPWEPPVLRDEADKADSFIIRVLFITTRVPNVIIHFTTNQRRGAVHHLSFCAFLILECDLSPDSGSFLCLGSVSSLPSTSLLEFPHLSDFISLGLN